MNDHAARLTTPDRCRARDNPGERVGRVVARVCHRIGVRYRLFRRQTQVAFPEIEITLPGLPPALDGLRIVQVTDLHYTCITVKEDYDRLLERVAGLGADLYVFTGDNVSYDERYIEPIIAKLGRLRAPLGSFAVLGNHDYWEGAPTTARCYAEQGIRLLVNEHVRIETRGGALYLAGIDDHCEGDPDLARALDGIPAGAPVVLLAHIPVAALDPATARVGLILSGHVHGGLVNLPGWGPLRMPECSPRRFIQGYYRTEWSQLYLSSGVGTSVVWFRYRAQPEVPVLLLRAPR